MGTKGIISTMIQDRALKRGREGGGAKSDQTELTATLRQSTQENVEYMGVKRHESN